MPLKLQLKKYVYIEESFDTTFNINNNNFIGGGAVAKASVKIIYIYTCFLILHIEIFI